MDFPYHNITNFVCSIITKVRPLGPGTSTFQYTISLISSFWLLNNFLHRFCLVLSILMKQCPDVLSLFLKNTSTWYGVKFWNALMKKEFSGKSLRVYVQGKSNLSVLGLQLARLFGHVIKSCLALSSCLLDLFLLWQTFLWTRLLICLEVYVHFSLPDKFFSNSLLQQNTLQMLEGRAQKLLKALFGKCLLYCSNGNMTRQHLQVDDIHLMNNFYLCW